MAMKKRAPTSGTLLIWYYLKICSAMESTGKPVTVAASLFVASTMPSAMMYASSSAPAMIMATICVTVLSDRPKDNSRGVMNATTAIQNLREVSLFFQLIIIKGLRFFVVLTYTTELSKSTPLILMLTRLFCRTPVESRKLTITQLR